MGLFDWLFGNKAHRPAKLADDARPREETVESGSLPDFIEIPSCRFFGLSAKSPNGRYTLAWRDRNDAGSHGGHRTSESGRYILLDGKTVIADGRMRRPNDGKVANNGTFVLNDWEFTSDLSGTFWAFRADGRKIVSRHFSANLFNNGLSSDGRFAACQTANSDTEDGSLLTLFDLADGIEIAAWRPESGWASSYSFSGDDETVRLGYRDLGSFRYAFDGRFLDREKWVDASLAKGSLVMVDALLKEKGEHLPPELADEMIKSIERVLSATAASDFRTRAWGLKLRGLCLEATGSLAAALDSFESAIALDPKSGVKRRIDKLKKSIAGRAS